ncbi:MAG: bifunctional methylenetetrahydrofolate dehydrogenase/methenyltetrahydrofolate cyclohydrolase FolD [Alphaproteobacteria bacterium]|nr:bifunctional methylenetetrahydrofolate dehydrogenase/methenyltetrahydrofolate cyclohydrolase FolD [Alphaproteobacteria bacterium]
MAVSARRATVIDGKAVAAERRADLAKRVAALKADHGLTPTLAVFLVGDDPASAIYVRNKGAAAAAAGIRVIDVKLPATASEADLLARVGVMNGDPAVNGILVQLPLPKTIAADAVIDALDPAKDVDGLHPENIGRLAAGRDGLVPCTPRGCLILLERTLGTLDGRRALVVGRSNLVGRPAAQLLLRANCTVTIAHSRTRDLAAECRRAEIVVAAIGRSEFVRGDWVAPGATVIDVGINRVTGSDGKDRIVGDVAFAEVVEVAGAITPVPGGVGPMTIACLLENTYEAACRQRGLELDQ